MVVLDLIVREHCAVSSDVVRVERRCTAAMVGDAVCLCYGLDCYPPNWGHSSNNQPGIEHRIERELVVVVLVFLALGSLERIP